MNWKIITLILVTANVSGCGSEVNHIVDERVLPYLEVFKQESNARGITPTYPHGSIVFSELDDTLAGVCHYKDNEDNWKIELDEPYWNEIDYYSKLELVFHELGHCMYRQDHREKLSIMNPVMLNPGVFENNYGSLVDEFFYY